MSHSFIFQFKLLTCTVFWDYHSVLVLGFCKWFWSRSSFYSPPCSKRNGKQMPSSHPTFHSPSPVSDTDARDSVLWPFPPCNYSLIWKNLSERKLTSVIYLIAPSKGAPTTVASCFQFCPSILHWGIAVCSLAHQPLGEYFHAHVVGHSLRRHARSYNIEGDTILGLPLRMLSPHK